MYCQHCGLALDAMQGFCPRCGHPRAMAPAPDYRRSWRGAGSPFGYPLGLVARRVDALATGWLVYAALIALTGFVGLAFAHAALNGHLGPFWHGSFGPHFGHRFGHGFGQGWSGPGMPFLFLRFAWVTLAIRAGLAFVAGWGLLHKAPWGRWVAILAGCLALFHPLFGTAMGIWTLIVLLSAPNAHGYEVMARG